MGHIAAVILDVDGTLLSSNDAHARAFAEAASELDTRMERLHREAHGAPLRQIQV